MGATVMGSFVNKGEISADIPSFSEAGSFQPGFSMFITGLDASNTVKLRRSTDYGLSWTDVTTYSANQAGTVITESSSRVAKHRLECVTKQAISVNGNPIVYKLTREKPAVA